MSYQIARNGDTLGTYTEEELVEAVELGDVLVTDLAWTEGMEDWVLVETLVEIEEEDEATESAPEQPATPHPKEKPTESMVRPLGQPHATTHYTAPPAAPVVSPERYGAPAPRMVRGSPYASIPRGHYGPAGSAIASLVLGILSLALLFLTGVPAILCGHMARKKIRRSGGTFSGHGMAVAGMVLGYVTTTLSLLWLIAYFTIGNIFSTLTETRANPASLPPQKAPAQDR